MKYKTIKEWFNELPESHRVLALENLEKQNDGNKVNDRADSMKWALFSGFDWAATPEGFDFWKTLYFKL